MTEHLKDTFLSEPSYLPHLLGVFKQWISGCMSERVRPWLAALNLVGLSKPNGDVRPVAIGEVLPRILARALCILLRPDMESHFAPCNQLGVGTRSGVEILAHAFRFALAIHPSWCALQIDVANAFNSFHRHAMFDNLRDSPFAGLIPFLHIFSGVPSSLFLHAGPFVETLASERGSRQGDPFGPFLFAFTQQLVMEPTMKDFPYLLFQGYANDTYVLGPRDRVLAAYSILREQLEWAASVVSKLGVAGEEQMFGEFFHTPQAGDLLGPWFAKALDQLPPTVRQELPSLGLCSTDPPLRPFPAHQRRLAVESLQSLRRMAHDDATLARLTSLQGPGAAAWVSAVPAHDDVTFTPVEWSISAAIRLGLPIRQLIVAGKCVCGVEFKDPSDPHHALRCKHQYAPSRVHDEVKLVVAKIAKASGGVVTVEDDTLLAGKRVEAVWTDGWLCCQGAGGEESGGLPSFSAAAQRGSFCPIDS
ncbi:unnamed protein product [Closterium sp. NIES-54]